MKLLAIQPCDLSVANEWRRARGVPLVPDSALPETGAIAIRADGLPIAALWLYITNSKLAWLAWPVSNPQARPREAYAAIRALAQHLKELARVCEIRFILTTSASRGLTKLFEGVGMVKDTVEHDMLTMEVKDNAG